MAQHEVLVSLVPAMQTESDEDFCPKHAAGSPHCGPEEQEAEHAGDVHAASLLLPSDQNGQLEQQHLNEQQQHTEQQQQQQHPAAWQSYSSVFTAAKAGMQGVDQERVKQIVYEMSKDSAHFANEQRKQAQTDARIAKLKAQAARLSAAELAAHQKVCDAKVSVLEAGRDLSKVWLHVDMDAFYASVEELDQPDLKDRPMAVGGLGMICTANYQARKYGVRSAMPGFIARKLCPQLVFVKPDFAKYTKASGEVFAVFRSYDEAVEGASLDEAYLDVTHYCSQHGVTGEQVASELRAKVVASTRLTCSVGVAPNMMLAKIASDKNKPNGQFVVGPSRDEVMAFIADLPIRKLPGIGKVTDQVLQALGIASCSHLMSQRALIAALMSDCSSSFLLRAGLGLGATEHSSRGGDSSQPARKGISCERTFAAMSKPADMQKMAESLVQHLAADMASEGIEAKTLTLKLKTSAFEVRTRAVTLPTFVSSPDAMLPPILKLLKAEQPVEIRLMGVRGSSLRKAPQSLEQQLTAAGSNKRLNALQRMILQSRQQQQQQQDTGQQHEEAEDQQVMMVEQQQQRQQLQQQQGLRQLPSPQELQEQWEQQCTQHDEAYHERGNGAAATTPAAAAAAASMAATWQQAGSLPGSMDEPSGWLRAEFAHSLLESDKAEADAPATVSDGCVFDDAAPLSDSDIMGDVNSLDSDPDNTSDADVDVDVEMLQAQAPQLGGCCFNAEQQHVVPQGEKDDDADDGDDFASAAAGSWQQQPGDAAGYTTLAAAGNHGGVNNRAVASTAAVSAPEAVNCLPQQHGNCQVQQPDASMLHHQHEPAGILQQQYPRREQQGHTVECVPADKRRRQGAGVAAAMHPPAQQQVSDRRRHEHSAAIHPIQQIESQQQQQHCWGSQQQIQTHQGALDMSFQTVVLQQQQQQHASGSTTSHLTSSSSSAVSSTWVCLVCTFSGNKQQWLRCSVCETPKGDTQAPALSAAGAGASSSTRRGGSSSGRSRGRGRGQSRHVPAAGGHGGGRQLTLDSLGLQHNNPSMANR